MKRLIQILFLSLIWFTNLVNATPVFTKAALPNYEFTFSKSENVKKVSVVKIGVDNFTPAERQLIAKQEKIWKELEVADNVLQVAGNNIDNLFSSILNEADFQGFRTLFNNNSKIIVELTDATWSNFVTQTKSTFGIGNKRNLAKIEFDGQQKLIASGEGFNSQMANSGQFIPEEFITQVKNGERVFEPSIATRHLDKYSGETVPPVPVQTVPLF